MNTSIISGTSTHRRKASEIMSRAYELGCKAAGMETQQVAGTTFRAALPIIASQISPVLARGTGLMSVLLGPASAAAGSASAGDYKGAVPAAAGNMDRMLGNIPSRLSAAVGKATSNWHLPKMAQAILKSAYIGGVATPQTVQSQESVARQAADTHAGQQHTVQPNAPAGDEGKPIRPHKKRDARVGTTLAPMFGMDSRSEAKKDTLKEKDQD